MDLPRQGKGAAGFPLTRLSMSPVQQVLPPPSSPPITACQRTRAPESRQGLSMSPVQQVLPPPSSPPITACQGTRAPVLPQGPPDQQVLSSSPMASHQHSPIPSPPSPAAATPSPSPSPAAATPEPPSPTSSYTHPTRSAAPTPSSHLQPPPYPAATATTATTTTPTHTSQPAFLDLLYQRMAGRRGERASGTARTPTTQQPGSDTRPSALATTQPHSPALALAGAQGEPTQPTQPPQPTQPYPTHRDQSPPTARPSTSSTTSSTTPTASLPTSPPTLPLTKLQGGSPAKSGNTRRKRPTTHTAADTPPGGSTAVKSWSQLAVPYKRRKKHKGDDLLPLDGAATVPPGTSTAAAGQGQATSAPEPQHHRQGGALPSPSRLSAAGASSGSVGATTSAPSTTSSPALVPAQMAPTSQRSQPSQPSRPSQPSQLSQPVLQQEAGPSQQQVDLLQSPSPASSQPPSPASSCPPHPHLTHPHPTHPHLTHPHLTHQHLTADTSQEALPSHRDVSPTAAGAGGEAAAAANARDWEGQGSDSTAGARPSKRRRSAVGAPAGTTTQAGAQAGAQAGMSEALAQLASATGALAGSVQAGGQAGSQVGMAKASAQRAGPRARRPRAAAGPSHPEPQAGTTPAGSPQQPRPARARRRRAAVGPRKVYPPGVWASGDEEDPRVAVWSPPPSPYSLLEEVLYDDPWALLMACILLNKTSATQVRRVLGALLHRFPCAECLASAGDAGAQEELQALLRPLGLFRKRAAMLVRFSHEYLHKQWHDPRELHGVGRYGADAYALFCRGAWRTLDAPLDKDLLKYWTWLHATGGQGEGLQRESLEHVLARGRGSGDAAAGGSGGGSGGSGSSGGAGGGGGGGSATEPHSAGPLTEAEEDEMKMDVEVPLPDDDVEGEGEGVDGVDWVDDTSQGVGTESSVEAVGSLGVAGNLSVEAVGDECDGVGRTLQAGTSGTGSG